jgi:hypothetical protein
MRADDESIFMKLPHRVRGTIAWSARVLALAALLSACASPYVDSRREAGRRQPVGASTPDMIAICFAPSKTPRSQVLAMAQPECAKTGRVAAYDHEDPWSCTLRAPTRAFYRCVAKP